MIGWIKTAWRRLTGGRPAPAPASSRLRESYYPGAVDKTGPHADHLFNRRMGDQTYRDLPPHKHEQMLHLVWQLYSSKPLAKRGLDMMRDFVIGEGMTVVAEDKRVQALVNAHWHNHVNAWPKRLEDRTLELGMNGEVLEVSFVDDRTGEVRWCNIDPLLIKEVERDPTNPDRAAWVHLKKPIEAPGVGSVSTRPTKIVTDADGTSRVVFDTTRHKLRVIHVDERAWSPTRGKLVGDCTFTTINKIAGATRGLSDLAPVIDWVPLHEQFLHSMHDAAAAKVAYVWDIEVENATPELLEDVKKQGLADEPESGATRLHGDNVTIKAEAPDLGTADLEAHAGVLKRHIAVGLGIPEHWLSESPPAGDGAVEAGAPTTKRLRARQGVMRGFAITHVSFALDQAVIAGVLHEDVDRTVKVSTPPVWPIDTQRVAAAMQTTGQSVVGAMQGGLISRGEARQFFMMVASQMGIEADVFGKDLPDLDELKALTDAQGPQAGQLPAAQPDQLAQRQTAQSGGLARPAVPGMNTSTISGMAG